MLAAHIGGRAVGCAEGDHRSGLLGIQAPVQHTHQGLGHVLDDGGAAGRAGGHQEVAALATALLEHQGGGHGTARALASRHPVGDGQTLGVSGCGREVGQLVVQQEAALGHVERPKAGLHRGGHGHDVAGLVDHREVGGAVVRGRAMLAVAGGPEYAGLGRAHAAGGADQRRTRLQVALVQHRCRAATGQGHEVGVGDVQVAVGVGQALRLRHQVHAHYGGLAAVGVQGRGLLCAKVKVLQHAQRLRHGQAAGGRRPHAAHLPAAVDAADGFALLGAVVGQIGQGGQARSDAAIGVGDLVDDVLGDGAAVEGGSAALGDGPVGGGQGRALEQAARGLGGAVSIQEVGLGLGVAGQAGGRAGH